jgi:hypothetical protein
MTKIVLSWPANPAAEQVTKYQVFWSQNGGAFSSAGFATGGATSFEIVSPPPGVHAFKVKALNLAGASPDSPVASTPEIPSAPGQPTATVVES